MQSETAVAAVVGATSPHPVAEPMPIVTVAAQSNKQSFQNADGQQLQIASCIYGIVIVCCNGFEGWSVSLGHWMVWQLPCLAPCGWTFGWNCCCLHIELAGTTCDADAATGLWGCCSHFSLLVFKLDVKN